MSREKSLARPHLLSPNSTAHARVTMTTEECYIVVIEVIEGIGINGVIRVNGVIGVIEVDM